MRARPQFGAATPPTGSPDAAPSSGLIADELWKLAELYKEGMLTDEEFAAQKARLLSPGSSLSFGELREARKPLKASTIGARR